MQASRIKQPMGMIAGGCILLSTIIMFFFASLPYGSVAIANVFSGLLEPYDMASFLDSLLWLLVFPAGIFVGISAIIGNTKLIAISLFIYGGLNILDCLVIVVASYGNLGTLLMIFIPISCILVGVALLTNNSILKLASAITAALGLLLYIIRRVLMTKDSLNYGYEEPGRVIAAAGLWVIANLLLIAAIVLIVFAKEQTATVGAVHKLYMAAQPMAAQAAISRCPSCGATIAPGSAFCGSCGSKVEPAEAYSAQTAVSGAQTMPNTAQPAMNAAQAAPNNYANRQASPMDAPSTGYAVLCFFFPVVGLILYLVWKDEFPMRAKSAGKGAIIGVIANVVLTIIYVLIAVAAATMY